MTALTCKVFLACAAAVLSTSAGSAVLKEVSQSGVLRVCAAPHMYRISYHTGQPVRWEGVDADMARALAADLKVKLQFVESSALTLAADLEKNRCAVGMFGIPMTAALSQQVRFSKPTLFSQVHGVVHKWGRKVRAWDDVDHEGVVASLVREAPHAEHLRGQIKLATLRTSRSDIDSEYDVESGRADVWLTDVFHALRMQSAHEWVQVLPSPPKSARTLYGYAIWQGDEEWGTRVDAFVRDIKRDGRLLKSAEGHGLGKWVVTR